MNEYIDQTEGSLGTTITVEKVFYNSKIKHESLSAPEELKGIITLVQKFMIHFVDINFSIKKVTYT